MASGCGIGFRFSSKSYTSGTAVGIFRPDITVSEMPSKYFTSARRELPDNDNEHTRSVIKKQVSHHMIS